jgi:hypothetical protein
MAPRRSGALGSGVECAKKIVMGEHWFGGVADPILARGSRAYLGRGAVQPQSFCARGIVVEKKFELYLAAQ